MLSHQCLVVLCFDEFTVISNLQLLLQQFCEHATKRQRVKTILINTTMLFALLHI